MNMGNYIYYLLRVRMELARSLGRTGGIASSGTDIESSISVNL
jgi:hypothetical protein